jgi:hypothetical protein
MEPRTEQDLFNKIADIIDFQPRLYRQSQWGRHDDLVVFEDSNGKEDETYYTSAYLDDCKPVDFNLDTGEDEVCGTAACVAGWAAIFNGWHPTLRNMITPEGKVWASAKSWNNSGAEESVGIDGYVPKLRYRYIEMEYGFVANKSGICCDGLGWSDFEDEEGNPIEVDVSDGRGGTATICRINHLGQDLLQLEHDEAEMLFNGEIVWESEDLRQIGKGASIWELYDVLMEESDREMDESEWD